MESAASFFFFLMTSPQQEACGKWSVTYLNRFQSPAQAASVIFQSLLKGTQNCTAGRHCQIFP